MPYAIGIMNARAQDVVLASENLTQKQEDFARYYVECRNATTAYRMAYDVDMHARGAPWVWEEASRSLRHPGIAARIAELQEAAEAHTIIKARDLVQDWVDMAATDGGEISQLATINCRHCYGEDGRYQWASEAELLDAVQKCQDEVDRGVKHVKFPDVRGGFGYVVRRPPNPDCVKCDGAGKIVARFTDTDKLSVKARKTYKGVKVTSAGAIEVMTHDTQAVRIELAKVLGLYGKDVLLNPAAAAKPAATGATEAEAALAYQRMIGSA